jgi:hypothetical protein
VSIGMAPIDSIFPIVIPGASTASPGVADGLTVEQIAAEYPQLHSEDIFAALVYAAEVQ